MRSRLSRRSFVSFGIGSCLPNAFLREPPVEEHELEVADSPRNLSRAMVALPSRRKASDKLPVLVLLHGLGETTSPKLGLRAWLDAYGVPGALECLYEGHLPADAKYGFLSEEERYAIGTSLHEQPFRGLCLVCPFLPNPYVGGNWQNALGRYAGWLSDKLLPAVRREFGGIISERVGLAGVSLGGFSALECYLQRPSAFDSLGSIQGAFSKIYAQAAAKRLLAAGGNPAVYVSTSSTDPYRVANIDFAHALEAAGASVRLNVRKGPHSQAWLREVGTLDALLWHDRALR